MLDDGGETVRADQAPRVERDLAEDDPVLCRHCGAHISRRRWRMTANGDHEHVVFNPAGRVFRVLCYSDAPGAVAVGPSSTAFTWFRGYAWTVCVCLACGSHVGWRYTATGAADDRFFGLVAAAVTVPEP